MSDTSDRKKKPEAIGKIVASWLGERGLTEGEINSLSRRSTTPIATMTQNQNQRRSARGYADADPVGF